MAEATVLAEPGTQAVKTLEDYRSERCGLEDLLQLLPSETSREYEHDLAEIALKIDRVRLQRDLEAAVRNEDEDMAFAAFFCGTVLLRRMKDFTVLEDWFNNHGGRFAARPAYNHTRVMCDLERGLRNVEVAQTLRRSRRSADEFPNNSGFVHLYADVVATAGELALDAGTDPLPAETLSSGLEFVDRAIDLEPGYAKFHATKARLLALKGNFREALACIKNAIDQEDSSRSDYAIRIGHYQFVRLWIQSQENDRRLRAKIEEYSTQFDSKHAEAELKLGESVRKMDNSTIKNLEFLGFFAALISFTIGSLQMAVNFAPGEAAKLIIVLMGALLVAFSGFSFILERHSGASPWRVLMAGAIGLLACMGGALVWFR